MTKAVIDIGNKEMAAGCTFVALSRLKTLFGLLIQPMAVERLRSIGYILKENATKNNRGRETKTTSDKHIEPKSCH